MQPGRDDMIDPIYDLPEEAVRDVELRALYFLVVERLRRQVEDAGLGFDAHMLAERCAFLYITLRQKEARTNGVGYHGDQQNKLNKLWMEFQREFATMVRQAPKKQVELLKKLQEVIYDVVSQQPKNLQHKLANDFSSAFEREKIL